MLGFATGLLRHLWHLLFLVHFLLFSAFAFGESSLHALGATLRKGGHVLFMRHTATDPDFQPPGEPIIEDCSTQRRLSALGKEQAKSIGLAIRAMGIPISEVLTSPLCRCKEMALLAFGKAQEVGYLAYSLGLPKPNREAAARELRLALSQLPAEGTNRVIISHNTNLKEAADIWPEAEGETHIFKPTGSSFTYIARVTVDEWLLTPSEQTTCATP